MGNIRAGVAYIDVRLGSIERFKKDLKDRIETIGKESGEKIGTDLGTGIEAGSKKSIPEVAKKTSDRFSKRFGENLVRSGQILRVGFIAWLLPAAIAAGPFIGGVLGAGIIAGIPLAVIGGGIALVAKDQRIKKAGEDIGKMITADLTKAASTFIHPLLISMDILKKAWKTNLKDINGIFFNAAAFIIPLTTGISDGITAVIKGVADVVRNAGPVIKILADGFRRIGVAIGEMLTKISEDPEAIKGMGDALEDLIGIIVLVIGWLGNFIVSASRAYSQFKESWGAIKDWFSSVIVPSLKRAADQAVAVWNGFNKFIDSLPGWAKARWDAVYKAVRDALNKTNGAVVSIGASIVAKAKGIWDGIVKTVGGLPGRLFNAGVSAMMGFFNGIASIGGRIIQKARDIANSVADTIRNALSIFSPSRVMEKLGKFTMLGFEKGLSKTPVDINSYLPKGIPATVGIDFGSPKAPQMDRDANAALHIDNYYANDNVDPWRQSEDWYFMVSARGGIA